MRDAFVFFEGFSSPGCYLGMHPEAAGGSAKNAFMDSQCFDLPVRLIARAGEPLRRDTLPLPDET